MVCGFYFFYKAKNKFNWGDPEKKEYTIYSDGAGYYIHLPQWFIYKEKNYPFLEKLNEKYPSNRFGNNLTKYPEGVRTSKYYPGTAVLISPFFLSAHLLAKNSSDYADGYSKKYQVATSLAAIFYWLIGCIGLFLVLKRLKIDLFSCFLVVLMFSLGTSLYYYTISAPTFSHVYGFCVVNWIVYAALAWAETKKATFFLLLSFLVGFIVIIRPTSALIVTIIPFLFKNFEEFKQVIFTLFKYSKKYLIFALILFSLPLLFHLWNSYTIGGTAKLYTYRDEGFSNLLSPEIWNILFSYRKGLFVYAPLLILFIPGLWIAFKHRRYLAWGLLLTFSLFTYVSASWWCWFYGGGLGMRQFIDLYIIMAVPIGLLFHYANIWKKTIYLSIAVLGTLMYQVYDSQLNKNILHQGDINKADFWHVFLKTDYRFNWYPYLTFDNIPKGYSFKQKLEIETSPSHLTNQDWIHFETLESQYEFELFWENNIKTEDYFIGRLSTDIIIYHPHKKPVFVVTYYQKNNLISSSEFFFAAKVRTLEKPTQLDIDLNPDIRLNDLDSLKVQLRKGEEKMSFKNISLLLYQNDD